MFRLLGRSVDLWFDLPAPPGLMELMFFVCSCVLAFSGVPWTYRFAYPAPPGTYGTYVFHVFWLVRVASRARRGRAARCVRQAIPAAGAAEGSGAQIHTFLKRNVPKTKLDRILGSPFRFKPDKIISRMAKIAGQTPFLQGSARFSGTAQRNATSQ